MHHRWRQSIEKRIEVGFIEQPSTQRPDDGKEDVSQTTDVPGMLEMAVQHLSELSRYVLIHHRPQRHM